MSAKHKLKSVHFTGSMIVAGVVGLLTESVVAFLIALVTLLVASYHAGDIRR